LSREEDAQRLPLSGATFTGRRRLVACLRRNRGVRPSG
jgi:hypothetical protein